MSKHDRHLLDLSSLTILVADDNDVMRSTFKQLLRTYGARKIFEAHEGAEALQQIEERAIDILITNWDMRPIDGIETVRILRRHPVAEKQMMPVIMVSAHSTPRNVRYARDCGVNEFLTKPVAPIDLYLRLEEIILRPRAFIKCPSYIGPDRHRHDGRRYSGPKRRVQDQGKGQNGETAAEPASKPAKEASA
ncbi:MAG: response regulator [Rhodospirillales bacterium]|nr:response regulator [Rhodospirillales bacterium]